MLVCPFVACITGHYTQHVIFICLTEYLVAVLKSHQVEQLHSTFQMEMQVLTMETLKQGCTLLAEMS